MTFTVRAVDDDHESIRKAILQPLVAFNTSKAGPIGYRPIAFAIDDDRGNTIGGLSGYMEYGWLFVELLFVPESLRGRGVGTELMRRAEAEAVTRGCHSVWLDTFEFQARGFYERLGYTCFGELTNYPVGSRFFMSKTLADRHKKGHD
jgi:GNAT superfamily N-acetyltransferase